MSDLPFVEWFGMTKLDDALFAKVGKLDDDDVVFVQVTPDVVEHVDVLLKVDECSRVVEPYIGVGGVEELSRGDWDAEVVLSTPDVITGNLEETTTRELMVEAPVARVVLSVRFTVPLTITMVRHGEV
jgi:hypothetical protein